MVYERGPGGGAGLFAAFAIGVGAGALGLFAFLEWQKTQPTAGLRGDTTMPRRGYLDVVGSNTLDVDGNPAVFTVPVPTRPDEEYLGYVAVF